jgi:NADH:ubiquinone oxidoreductase subunit
VYLCIFNASRHSWLHFTTDAPLSRLNRPYAATYVENKTGTEQAYAPHNFMLNANYDPELVKNADKPVLDKHSARAKSMGFNVDDL